MNIVFYFRATEQAKCKICSKLKVLLKRDLRFTCKLQDVTLSHKLTSEN